MSDQDWLRVFHSKIDNLKKTDNWNLVFDDNTEGAEIGWQEYIRGAFSRFKCSICGHKWASSKVYMVFHMRLDRSKCQGTVKVRRYRQNCKTCPDAPFEKPIVSVADLQRMMDKVMEKILIKFYEQGTGTARRSFSPGKVLKGPHLKSHCEACLKGICTLRS